MVSIIIPSLGRPSLGRLIKSLKTFAASAGWRLDLDFEIVVSLDARAAAPVLNFQEGIRLVQGARPGVNCARNEGARKARGEFFWFLDDDTEVVCSDSFLILQNLFAQQDVEAAGGDYISDLEARWSERGYNLLCSLWRTTAGAYENEQLLGGTLAVRKTAWLRVGEFDEHIEYGGAETAFVQRLKKSAQAITPAQKILYLPELDVRHHPGDRGFRTWMQLAYRQGGRKIETRPELPDLSHRVARGFHFLRKQDVRSLGALFIFSIPYLVFSNLGRLGRR